MYERINTDKVFHETRIKLLSYKEAENNSSFQMMTDKFTADKASVRGN